MSKQSNSKRSGKEPAAMPPTGFLLSKAGRTQATRIAELLEPLGLRPPHFGLLNFIDREEGSSQQHLGDRMGLDPSGLVSLIDDLEQKGLVERRSDSADRRRHAIHITPAGRKTLARAREIALEREEELLAPLNKQERRAFHELLLRVVTAEDPQVRPLVQPRPKGGESD